MQKDAIYNEEKANLQGTLGNISGDLELVTGQVGNIQQTYNERLRSLSPSASETKEEILSNLTKYLIDKNYDSREKALKELEYQVKQPYFARIKFIPTSDKSIPTYDIYIGRYNYLKNSGLQPIVDWRAPVASIYYNYLGKAKDASFILRNHDRNKNVTIEKEITGSLETRRKLDIKDGELINVYETSEDIDVLSKAISDKTGGVLETIIESIQSEQDEIIRSDFDIPIIVQGTAGSGKTTIAVHKISYLIYTHSNLLNESNILLLLNSKILIKYVKNTLAELDVKNPQIYSLRRALVTKLEKFNDGYKLKYFDVGQDQVESTDYHEILLLIQTYCSEYQQVIEKKLSTILKRHKLGDGELFDEYPIYEKIKRLIKDLESSLDDLYEFEDSKSNPNYSSSNITKTEKTVAKLEEVLSTFSLTKEFEVFLKKHGFSWNASTYEYISFMYIFADELWGDATLAGKYNYTLVDEGQDYSELEYELIARLTYDARISIFGDINQLTNENIGDSWDKASNVINKFSKNPANFYNLKTSYRNTKQIAELNRSILKKYSKEEFLPVPYKRDGPKPESKIYSDRNDLLLNLSNDLHSMLKTDYRSACIIELNDEEIINTKNFLESKDIVAQIIDENLKDFNINKIYLASQNNIKGLEFSHIYIIDPSETHFPDNKLTARKLYILFSRAINVLRIYSIGKANKVIPAEYLLKE